jgi:hypothetical protein
LFGLIGTGRACFFKVSLAGNVLCGQPASRSYGCPINELLGEDVLGHSLGFIALKAIAFG